ncbi:MAG: hypothetical protein WBM90_03925 [Acidimicrobiia bacterium]
MAGRSSGKSIPNDVPTSRIRLFWIPLGAGGVGFVRLNGRIYELIEALGQRRSPLDLYHTALEIRSDDTRWVVENAWPSPDSDFSARGVVVEGPVFNKRLARLRPFRYEIRRWQNGVIPDAGAVGTRTELLSADAEVARSVLSLVEEVPPLVWGRDEMQTGEMWNSNSVISWLLTRAEFPIDTIHPPEGGRAPGWEAGTRIAGWGQAKSRRN